MYIMLLLLFLGLQISDVEQIIGLMHVESVQLIAESYDVALDISFPRGIAKYTVLILICDIIY